MQLSRFKEQVEKVSEEKEKLSLGDQAHAEEKNKLKRQVRDIKDQLGETQRREAELSQRKHDLVNITSIITTFYQNMYFHNYHFLSKYVLP